MDLTHLEPPVFFGKILVAQQMEVKFWLPEVRIFPLIGWVNAGRLVPGSADWKMNVFRTDQAGFPILNSQGVCCSSTSNIY